MAGLDGLVALLSGGAQGIDSEMERRRKQALVDREQSRLDDDSRTRANEGRRKAQGDVIDLQTKGYREVRPGSVTLGNGTTGSVAPILKDGDISLNDYDGQSHAYRYDEGGDRDYQRAIDGRRATADAADAVRKQKSDAQNAAWRIANGHPQPGDETLADPMALNAFQNRLHDDRTSDDGMTIRKLAEKLAQDRFDHHVNVDDPRVDERAAAKARGAAGTGIVKRTAAQRDAMAASEDNDTWGGDPTVPGKAHDAREQYFAEYNRLVPDVGPEEARVQALRNTSHMTGGGRPKADTRAAALAMLAQVVSGKGADTTGSRPPAAGPNRPATARSPMPTTPQSSAPSVAPQRPAAQPSAQRPAPPATRPTTGPVAKRAITADQADYLRQVKGMTDAQIRAQYEVR